ncbi:hypothetical protein ASL19_15935 [Cylindrospermopsis sp. CR12]|nr:hypothetical protein ASL19_15935 [Cylindrospermopsis sp. CR12]
MESLRLAILSIVYGIVASTIPEPELVCAKIEDNLGIKQSVAKIPHAPRAQAIKIRVIWLFIRITPLF